MNQLVLEIVVVWLIAILAGLPLFVSMGLAAFAFVLLGGLSPSIVPQKMAQAINSFPIVAAPLFILMGNILGAAKLTDRGVEHNLVGEISCEQLARNAVRGVEGAARQQLLARSRRSVSALAES